MKVVAANVTLILIALFVVALVILMLAIKVDDWRRKRAQRSRLDGKGGRS